MVFDTVTTPRLLVRAPGPADLADFLAYRNHPDNLRFQPLAPIGDADAATFLLAQAALDIAPGSCWMMCALELRGDGRMIGEVGMYLGAPADRRGDIGWSVHPDFQGQGYAVEGAKALLDFAFSTLKLHRVTATSNARNVASTRVMERLGMRREGTMKQSVAIGGEWQDEYAYALLREEWRS